MKFKPFPKRLREVMEGRNLKLNVFSKKVGVPWYVINSILNRKKELSYLELRKIAINLGLFPICFFDKEGKLESFGRRELINGKYPENYVGNVLFRARTLKRLSIKETSGYIAYDPSGLGKIERGRKHFDRLSVLEKVSETLDLVPLYLIDSFQIVAAEFDYAGEVFEEFLKRFIMHSSNLKDIDLEKVKGSFNRIKEISEILGYNEKPPFGKLRLKNRCIKLK